MPRTSTARSSPASRARTLNTHLRDTGLFFPIDPGANASLGGMAATRASGTNAVRYGTMRDNVLSLTAVMADGRVDHDRQARQEELGRLRSDAASDRLGRHARHHHLADAEARTASRRRSRAASARFRASRRPATAVIATIQMGIPVARIELVNALQMRAMKNYSKLDYPESPCLFVEFHGSDAGVAEQAETFGEIAAEFGGGPFLWTSVAEERTKLWKARHDAYWASLTLRPGAKGLSTDVCVPISRLAECIAETEADIAEMGLIAPIVGHVGDGNFHVLVLMDVDDPEGDRAGRGVRRAAQHARHRHGRHLHRRARHRPGQDRLPRQRARRRASTSCGTIKPALDPLNIMNPGKILPTASVAVICHFMNTPICV